MGVWGIFEGLGTNEKPLTQTPSAVKQAKDKLPQKSKQRETLSRATLLEALACCFRSWPGSSRLLRVDGGLRLGSSLERDRGLGDLVGLSVNLRVKGRL